MNLVKKPISPESYGDGTIGQARETTEAAAVSGEYCGKYYELCARGNLFIYETAVAGIALTTVAATNQFTVWNPAGSGKNFIPLVVRIGFVSGAAIIAGFIGYYRYPYAGANIGLPFSVFTDIAITPAYIGGPTRQVSSMRFSTTNTLPAAPTFQRTSNFSLLQGRQATAWWPFKMIEDLGGAIVVPPGTTFTIAGNAAIIPTVSICVIGAELPLILEA